MRIFKIVTVILFSLFVSVVKAELTPEEQKLYESAMNHLDVYHQYDTDEFLKSKEKLNEVEEKIIKLKKITSEYPDEPRLYFSISKLYDVRDTMLKRHIIYANREEWFSMPIAQETLQGTRDNLTEVARLLEEGKGKPIEVGGYMSTVISVQLYERFQRLYLKQNPNGLGCNDPENQECMPQSYEDFALETLETVANEYQGYGYFEDADRVLNDIEKLSEAGKAKAAELRPAYIEGRKTWSPEQVAEDSFLRVEGGAPKPLTIRGVEAIEENHKAALEKARLRKEAAAKAATTSSQAESSAPATLPTESAPTPVEENNNRLILIGAGIALLLLIGFVALRRRK
jgi:hypothetical protein